MTLLARARARRGRMRRVVEFLDTWPLATRRVYYVDRKGRICDAKGEVLFW